MDGIKNSTPSEKQSKKLTYRTPDKFRRNDFKQNTTINCRVRSFGGHK